MTDYILPTPPEGTIPTVDHSGNWASVLVAADGSRHRTSSEGAVVSIRYETGMFIYYTFEPNHFSRRFYIAYFKLDGESFPIFTSELIDGKVVEREIGKGQLYFTGPRKGVLRMDTEETDIYGVELEAMQLTQDPRSGPYVFDEESKNGYIINFFPEGLVTVHSFWHHESMEPWPGTFPKGNHTQEWESGIALPIEGGWAAQMRRVINGQRDNPMPVTLEDIEILTILETAKGFSVNGKAVKQIAMA